jgi:hypothetical protein
MKDLEGIVPDEIIGWCDYANKGTDNLSSPFAYVINGKKYIIGAVFSDEDSKQLEIPLLKKLVYFKPTEFVIESNQGGTEFADNFAEKYGNIFSAFGLEIETRSSSINKEIRILLRIGEMKSDCYFLIDEEQDEHYRAFMMNLVSYGRYKYTKDDAIDSMAGLLSMTSDIFDVDVNYLENEQSLEYSYNKILDIKRDNNFNVYESESDDSVMIF